MSVKWAIFTLFKRHDKGEDVVQSCETVRVNHLQDKDHSSDALLGVVPMLF